MTDRRDNNFNLIRMIAASCVLVSHSFPLSLGDGANEPLKRLTGESMGGLAVVAFFATSGYFITKSFQDKKSHTAFVVARVLRIFPALLVVSMLVTFALGPLITTATGYFTLWPTWRYVPGTLLLSSPNNLPGVFTANPYPITINGPLWTLRYEAMCYATVVIAGLCGLLSKRAFLLLSAAFLALYGYLLPPIVVSDIGPTFLAMFLPFWVGMGMYLYRAVLPRHWSVVALLGTTAWLAHGTPLELGALTLAVAYGALWLGFLHTPALWHYNRLGDYSYGMYICAWPVQQTVALLLPGISPAGMMLTAFPITLGLAMLSWRFVERPALDRRTAAAEALLSLRPRPSHYRTPERRPPHLP